MVHWRRGRCHYCCCWTCCSWCSVFFDFCFGFSQITVNCLVTTVISLTFWHSHYVEVLSRYSFMSVLSIITVRFVCAGWITARHHDSLSIHACQCSSRYGVHAPIAAGPANAEHVHNTAINEVTPIWAVLWYDTVRDRAIQFGQKKFRFRFDSRYRIDFFDSIRQYDKFAACTLIFR